MAKKFKIDGDWAANHRKANNMNQINFWAQYGVTQSGGSRYESGRRIPRAVRMLIALETGMASIDDLTTGRLVQMV